MKSFYLIILLFLLSITSFSCGHIDAEATLQQAENSLQDGNFELALSNCDLLTDTTCADPLTSTQMCRIAILYARLSEMSDNQDYMATAAQCYERAVNLDTDTQNLDGYIETLNADDRSVVGVIREISHVLNSPSDHLEEHDQDTDYANEEIAELTEIDPTI